MTRERKNEAEEEILGNKKQREEAQMSGRILLLLDKALLQLVFKFCVHFFKWPTRSRQLFQNPEHPGTYSYLRSLWLPCLRAVRLAALLTMTVPGNEDSEVPREGFSFAPIP